MSKKDKNSRGLSPDDRLLWTSVIESVTPVKSKRGKLVPSTSLGIRAPEKQKENPALLPSPRGIQTARPKSGQKSGIDHRTHQKLKRGKRAIEARIDLHGLSRDRAHDALAAFLERTHTTGKRTLLVITGKGSGILRTSVAKWLDENAGVLAVEPAQPKDGGSGAFYVLLRRKR